MIEKLNKQLLLITFINSVAIAVLFIILLPRLLIPVYEKNIYKYLKQPHVFIEENIVGEMEDVAYFFIDNNRIIGYSNNYKEIIKSNPIDIINQMKKPYGKIVAKNNAYYYYQQQNKTMTKVTITNDSYIEKMESQILFIILPIALSAFVLTLALLYSWSKILINRINKLKDKVDNAENDYYNHTITTKNKDELYDLEVALEQMRLRIKNNEKNKTEMYQNISHDLKTPISVIKSHIEAINDEIMPEKEALQIISDQTDKLNDKVESLIYLNKLNYFIEQKIDQDSTVNIEELILKEVNKFKIQNTNIKWDTSFDKSILRGTNEMWEIVIDNLLHNSIRYAKSEIKIKCKSNVLTIYNDGELIEEELLNTIFRPYEKGHNGNFGLGLSIVKKTVNLFGYEVSVQNKKTGVIFTIK